MFAGQHLHPRQHLLNLTLPIDAVAEVATVRLQDNDAKGCIGGFWFELTDSIAPQGQATAAQFIAVFKAIETFREMLFIQALAASYPLPTSPTPVAASSSALPTTTATFFITNNQIDALPAAGQSSMALMLLANRAVNTQVDTSVSMIISSNRFTNRVAGHSRADRLAGRGGRRAMRTHR